MSTNSPNPRQLIGLGAGLVGSVVFGLVVGWLLDAAFGTTPLFVMIGLFVGVVLAVAGMVVQFKKFIKDD